MMPLPHWSRMTSISYSFQPMMRLLDEHLARRRELEAFAHDVAQLVHAIGDAAAGAAEREARTQHERKAELIGQFFCIAQRNTR